MVDNVRVEIRGLREFRGALQQIERELPRELAVRYLERARDLAGRVASQVPRLTGRAAGSVAPRPAASGAALVAGGARAPHFPWLEFGGAVGRNRSVRRELVPDGRWIYPTIAEAGDEIGQAAGDAVESVARRAGFEVRGS